jgi:hypothetical protein
MSKGSRTDLCGGWPERAIPTATAGALQVGRTVLSLSRWSTFCTARSCTRTRATL